MSTLDTARRPVPITIIGVLGIIQGVFAILGGLALVIDRDDANLIDQVDRSSNTILALGIWLLVVGAITLLVAFALLRGSNVARLIIGVVEILHLAGGVYVLFAYSGTERWDGIIAIIIAALILYFLFASESAERFFTGRA